MISGVVFEALGVLVEGRCYPNTFEQPRGLPAWPAIRYQIVSGNPTQDICGTDAVDTDDTRVQVDGVAQSFGAMTVLRDQIIANMKTTNPPCARQPGMFETYDADLKVHRCTMDFVFNGSSQGT